MHVGVDQGSGLIRRQSLTPAHVHDIKLFERLVSGDEGYVYADKGYVSIKNDKFLKTNGIKNGILLKKESRHPVFINPSLIIPSIFNAGQENMHLSC